MDIPQIMPDGHAHYWRKEWGNAMLDVMYCPDCKLWQIAANTPYTRFSHAETIQELERQLQEAQALLEDASGTMEEAAKTHEDQDAVDALHASVMRIDAFLTQ